MASYFSVSGETAVPWLTVPWAVWFHRRIQFDLAMTGLPYRANGLCRILGRFQGALCPRLAWSACLPYRASMPPTAPQRAFLPCPGNRRRTALHKPLGRWSYPAWFPWYRPSLPLFRCRHRCQEACPRPLGEDRGLRLLGLYTYRKYRVLQSSWLSPVKDDVEKGLRSSLGSPEPDYPSINQYFSARKQTIHPELNAVGTLKHIGQDIVFINWYYADSFYPACRAAWM